MQSRNFIPFVPENDCVVDRKNKWASRGSFLYPTLFLSLRIDMQMKPCTYAHIYVHEELQGCTTALENTRTNVDSW